MGFFSYHCCLLRILVQVRYRKKTQNQTNQRRFQSFLLKQSLKFLLILKLPVSNRVHKLHTDRLAICLIQLACVHLIIHWHVYYLICIANIAWNSQKQTSVCTLGANANSIPLRDDHQAACGHGNHICLPSPCSTVGLEQFSLSSCLVHSLRAPVKLDVPRLCALLCFQQKATSS